jgi:hypothetical protein
MIFEDGHPDITLSDWESFRQWVVAGPMIEKVVDRSQMQLPPSVVPLARGVAVAGDGLLRMAGYDPEAPRPRGWRARDKRLFTSSTSLTRGLMVQEYGGLWSIERFRGRRDMQFVAHKILVHRFGSTPIFAPNLEAAMCLVTHCRSNSTPTLRWTATRPADLDGAIERAKTRQIEEAMVAPSTPGCFDL